MAIAPPDPGLKGLMRGLSSPLPTITALDPLPWVGGLPVVDERLRWEKLKVFVMGGWAALQVGPTARNLSGARMACERIIPTLIKASLA
ncbi:hypothetical protein VB712_07895 [Spirulina sp. CCNP1310]|uniref:hypothetical protein n=1 Tax=Spirulina sp. CCNP1310 TaxID=3110249 RepID=UPI002B20623E|nr:hypothetical protein [Spirulina sp. CCNP1310]MEA5419149.1 hypothetical protein [Spirulina sp. CCNP1310]